MNKILAYTFIIFFVLINFSVNNTARAALIYPWTGVVDPAGLVNNFYEIALALVGVASLGVIVYGGILYIVSAGNSSRQSDANEWIKGGIFGLVLLLCAYIILWTINSNLVILNNPNVPPIEIPPVVGQGPGPVGPTGPLAGSDSLVRRGDSFYIKDTDIKVISSRNCYFNSTGCTYVDGLPLSTIDKLNTISDSCGSTVCGELTVTGAAEPGHTTHGVGKPVVDLSDDPGLYEYLDQNRTEFGIVSMTNSPHGTGPHIHIVFNN